MPVTCTRGGAHPAATFLLREARLHTRLQQHEYITVREALQRRQPQEVSVVGAVAFSAEERKRFAADGATACIAPYRRAGVRERTHYKMAPASYQLHEVWVYYLNVDRPVITSLASKILPTVGTT